MPSLSGFLLVKLEKRGFSFTLERQCRLALTVSYLMFVLPMTGFLHEIVLSLTSQSTLPVSFTDRHGAVPPCHTCAALRWLNAPVGSQEASLAQYMSCRKDRCYDKRKRDWCPDDGTASRALETLTLAST